MSIQDEYLDVLQNLEHSVVSVYRHNPDMTDHVVLRAYEAAYEHYRSEQRGHPPKPHGLTGLDAATYDAIHAVCEFRLGRDTGPNPGGAPIEPISTEEIATCLRRLMRSVKLNTGRGGRQGYLDFVSRFVR